MSIIQGGTQIPGYGPYLNDGAPTDGATMAGTAMKGALLIDTANGVLYINTGTQESPAWTVVGSQA
ncbi:MAG TPA: hypothetical protein ENJ54_04280 [Chloroflexi bacterium]|nr:hypothetical protein [Chloroflexota bacterium]